MVQPSWSLTLDWQGFSRTELYYEASPEASYYGGIHLVLKPEIQVVDSLSIFSRLDLYPLESSYDLENRQTGFIFLNSFKDSGEFDKLSPLFFNLSQIYLIYRSDYFQMKLGRAPYHFGLGVTYSAETSPFDHWISTFNQLAFYFEYSLFYFEPSLWLKGKDLLSVNQIGLRLENWDIGALIRYDVLKSQFFLETLGRYKADSLEAHLSFSYLSESNLALIFEGGMDLPIGLVPRLELKTGYISKDFFVHPNYDVALLLGNRSMNLLPLETASNPLRIDEGRMNDSAYLSPRVTFNFLKNSLKLTPVVTLDYKLSEKILNYELDLNMHYQLEDNFSVSIQAGMLLAAKKSYYGLLTQAAVTF